MSSILGFEATKIHPEASEALGSGVLQKHQVAVVRFGSSFYRGEVTPGTTWRIIPVSKWLVNPICIVRHEKAIWKGSHNPILRGLTITMVIGHLLDGMILQVATHFVFGHL